MLVNHATVYGDGETHHRREPAPRSSPRMPRVSSARLMERLLSVDASRGSTSFINGNVEPATCEQYRQQ
jgi:hypothetical protein